MILYQLKCKRDHEFDAWFLNSATYDSQLASADITCPHCGTNEVVKAPMAPNIARRRENSSSQTETENRAKEVAEKILNAVNGLREEVEASCDYVGDGFAEEARRIHYGETKERDIYGEATDKEASELDEEGVDFFRLPFSRRRNDQN
ncbi:MAG: DUF1178 family protein [Pseudomonadota bacterium]|nr:DUF1178 family protein [Pseudomonadota bacterium]